MPVRLATGVATSRSCELFRRIYRPFYCGFEDVDRSGLWGSCGVKVGRYEELGDSENGGG